MLDSLVTSQTRIKLLMKFFLNSSTRAHLRGLESEFGESSNAIRVELNRFENAGLLNSQPDGNKKIYQANSKHPLFRDIHNIILKETGIDRVIEKVIHRLGNLICVYLTGDFARGKDSRVIELILVGPTSTGNTLPARLFRLRNWWDERSVILFWNPVRQKVTWRILSQLIYYPSGTATRKQLLTR